MASSAGEDAMPFASLDRSGINLFSLSDELRKLARIQAGAADEAAGHFGDAEQLVVERPSLAFPSGRHRQLDVVNPANSSHLL